MKDELISPRMSVSVSLVQEIVIVAWENGAEPIGIFVHESGSDYQVDGP